MKFEIKNRFTSEVQFTAEIEDSGLSSINIGLAVKWGIKNNANLSGANLSGANWIPEIKDIHKSVYQAASAKDALDMSTWHNECGTAHCRAGWVIMLAGEGGKVMEGIMGASAAAALIYAKNDPSMERVPDWYCTNEEALADMKLMAEAE